MRGVRKAGSSTVTSSVTGIFRANVATPPRRCDSWVRTDLHAEGDGDRQRHPDSFSDGGRFDTTEAAVAHALALLDEGAAVVDVGGESTRPAPRRSMPRPNVIVVPVIEGIVAARPDTIVSIDTTKAEVAEAALVAGARS